MRKSQLEIKYFKTKQKKTFIYTRNSNFLWQAAQERKKVLLSR